MAVSYSENRLLCASTPDVLLKENLEIHFSIAGSTSDFIFRTFGNATNLGGGGKTSEHDRPPGQAAPK